MFNIKLSDIAKETGDLVVNPSNTVLNLGSGVSGVLKMMCPELQKVMNEYIKNYGFLNPGDIAVTHYPCKEFKYAIHTAVMDYKKEAKQINPDLRRIEKICKNIAKFLDKKEVKVITPLLGTGVGGLNKREVFKIMEKYFKDLKADIILVVHKKSDFELLS